ncbi:MAG: glycosyltransferase family 4 protein [Cyclobacteriaceae bacterium]
MRIIFLVPYPLFESPSQRFRFEQYLSILDDRNVSFKIYSFLSLKGWRVLYTKGNTIFKVYYVVKGLVSRLKHLASASASSVDFVFIHREVAPVGPAIFEWIIVKIFKKKIIYDFDDAIWLTDIENESRLVKFIRSRSKIAHICKLSYKTSCGNKHLVDFALQFNANSIVNPTTIDTSSHHIPIKNSISKHNQLVRIGWTGSHSTLKYLKDIEAIFQNFYNSEQIEFVIISNHLPELSFPFRFIKWSKSSEIIDLGKIDIGLMPLPDNEWTRGKCGFKALQYMAMGIPCIASPVGVNSEIITHGDNGYLAESREDWTKFLTILVNDSLLREKLGKKGREKVEKCYSVSSNSLNFLSLFE